MSNGDIKETPMLNDVAVTATAKTDNGIVISSLVSLLVETLPCLSSSVLSCRTETHDWILHTVLSYNTPF